MLSLTIPSVVMAGSPTGPCLCSPASWGELTVRIRFYASVPLMCDLSSD